MDEQEIIKRTAEQCYKIACEVRDSFPRSVVGQDHLKHSGAAHVAVAIKEAFCLKDQK